MIRVAGDCGFVIQKLFSGPVGIKLRELGKGRSRCTILLVRTVMQGVGGAPKPCANGWLFSRKTRDPAALLDRFEYRRVAGDDGISNKEIKFGCWFCLGRRCAGAWKRWRFVHRTRGTFCYMWICEKREEIRWTSFEEDEKRGKRREKEDRCSYQLPLSCFCFWFLSDPSKVHPLERKRRKEGKKERNCLLELKEKLQERERERERVYWNQVLGDVQVVLGFRTLPGRHYCI